MISDLYLLSVPVQKCDRDEIGGKAAFAKRVTELMKKGWQPVPPVNVQNNTYYLTFIKEFP